MKDLEAALAAMLADRAARIEPGSGHHESTMRAARRRRVGTIAVATAASLALAVGAFGAVGGSNDSPAPRPAALDERTNNAYTFTSRPGEYPFVATGEFRNAEWQLRAAAVAPGGSDDRVRITLQIEGRVERLMTTSTETFRGEPVFVRYEDSAWMFGGDVALVFGAVAPETESVEVWIHGVDRGDRTFPAHVFEGYDAKTGLTADYYVAFVPGNRLGLVIATDGNGDEVGAVTIPQR
jgi:hypothetical protein